MQIDKKILNDVKRGCDYLMKNYDHFADYREDLEFSDDPNDYDEFDYIPFYFPGEHDYIEFHITNFLRLVDEFPTLEIINKGRIKTKSFTYQIVGTASAEEEHVIKDFHDFSLSLDNGIHINIIENSFIHCWLSCYRTRCL